MKFKYSWNTWPRFSNKIFNVFKVVLVLESFEQCSPLLGCYERSKVYLSRGCYENLVVRLKTSHQGSSLDGVRKPDLGTTMEITKLTFHRAILNTICKDSKLSFSQSNLKHAKCTFKRFNLNHTKWTLLESRMINFKRWKFSSELIILKCKMFYWWGQLE